MKGFGAPGLPASIPGEQIGSGTVPLRRLSAPASRVSADVPNATATFAALTELGFAADAGISYVGQLVLRCANTVAAEGIKLDFAGGDATFTDFFAAASAPVGGTTVLGAAVSTSGGGVINFTTITGDTVIVVNFSVKVNAAGTVKPRFAENSHATGTVTVNKGSFMLATPTS